DDTSASAVHDRPWSASPERNDGGLRPAGLRLQRPQGRGGRGRPLPLAAHPRTGPLQGPLGRLLRLTHPRLPNPVRMEESPMASVDVIVPCYNYGRFLEECVRSVLNQDGVDVKVLIIDDASSDNTPEVGRALAAADPRVEYRRHAANQGHIATYNE